VWVEFEGGDLAHPIWTGTWWGTDEVPEAATPAQKVLKTAAGHVIVLDDEAETLTVTDSNGNSVSMGSDGVVIEDVNGSTVTMGASGVTVSADTVTIGGQPTDHLVGHRQLDVALQALVTVLATHTHVASSFGAPTTPPATAIVLSLDAAKSRHQVEL
jgi:hypothetical protein